MAAVATSQVDVPMVVQFGLPIVRTKDLGTALGARAASNNYVDSTVAFTKAW